MSAPPGRRKYDTFNPSALPTANVGRGRIALDKDGKDPLEVQYEAWNKRLDEEVGSLAKGLQELVELSNVSHVGMAKRGQDASLCPCAQRPALRPRRPRD